MFAYCNNNPVNALDANGQLPIPLITGLIAAGGSIITDLVCAAVAGDSIGWGDVGFMFANALLAGVSGALWGSSYAIDMAKAFLKYAQAGIAFVETLYDGGDFLSALTSAGLSLLSGKIGDAAQNAFKNPDDVAKIGIRMAEAGSSFAISGGRTLVEHEVETYFESTRIPAYSGLSHSDPGYSDPNWMPWY